MSAELQIVAKGMDRCPVPVEEIIQDLGIRLVTLPMPAGVSGFLEHRHGAFAIGVNAQDSRQRQRFTAAHQLAHFLLHRDMLADPKGPARHVDQLYGREAASSSPAPFTAHHQLQANRLAADILMPQASIQRLFEAGQDNVRYVAEALGVSSAAMEIRLKTLGLRTPQPTSSDVPSLV